MIAPQDGIDALDRLMRARVTQAVAPCGSREWGTAYPALLGAPLLRTLRRDLISGPHLHPHRITNP